MQKIAPFLWFNDMAEEAANFYISIFKNSKIVSISHYSDEAAKASGKTRGTVMVVVFKLNGQEFMAINGGPQFSFSPAISFLVNCQTQEEIDDFWEKLSKGGKTGQCGWLEDKYGISWQIVPTILGELIANKNIEKSSRVMEAMLKMTKIDISTLKQSAMD